MKNAFTATLLSGLVFPGLGQIVLKRYARGVALALTTVACFTVLLVKTKEIAEAVFAQISTNLGTVDLYALSSAVSRACTPRDILVLQALTLLMLIFWVLGTVDAYLLGRRKDRTEEETPGPGLTKELP